MVNDSMRLPATANPFIAQLLLSLTLFLIDSRDPKLPALALPFLGGQLRVRE